MDKLTGGIVAIFAGITTVAILAVLVSKNSNTANVITSTFGGYATALGAAVSPVVGGGMSNAHFNMAGSNFTGN